jgi:hypothetical protein
MGIGDGIIVGIVGVNGYNYEIWNSNLRILTYDYITHLLVELQPQVTASMFWWYHEVWWLIEDIWGYIVCFMFLKKKNGNHP